jgi:hypothetical protein
LITLEKGCGLVMTIAPNLNPQSQSFFSSLVWPICAHHFLLITGEPTTHP